MYYTSQDKETLDAYNAKIVTGENYDGTTTVLWANVVEHHEGGSFAILKHNGYQLIDGEEDAPTVDSISDFFPPLEDLN
jgi:hypothetical protein